jgi:Zn-dependent alcohol dehydrogenase
MRTKGALVWGLDEPWSIEEIEIGDPRRGEVRSRWRPRGCATQITT